MYKSEHSSCTKSRLKEERCGKTHHQKLQILVRQNRIGESAVRLNGQVVIISGSVLILASYYSEPAALTLKRENSKKDDYPPDWS